MTREDIANFWNKLINSQNSDKAEGGAAENIPSEEIAKLNEKITKAFNDKGGIEDIIKVTEGIFNARVDKTKIDNFKGYLTQKKGESSFPNLLKEYEKFLRNTISQNKKEQNISFFSDNFACVGGTIARLELYNNPPFIEMIINLSAPYATSFVSNNNQVHVIALKYFLAGFNTEDVHKFAPATDPLMTKEVMEEICKLTDPVALLDMMANEIADGLLELGKSVKNEEDDKEIVKIINESNVKRYIDILIKAIQKAYPNIEEEGEELSLHKALQSPQLYLLYKEKYLPFSMIDEKDTEDGVDKEDTEDEVKKKIKNKIVEGINQIIRKAEGEKNEENEINQYITEEQKAKFEQIGKLFLIFIRGHHDYQLTIEDFNELVGEGKILIKPNNLQYEINPEFENILPEHLKKYFSDKFLPNLIKPLIEQLESNKKISDAVGAIKYIDPQKENSLIVSALDEKCNGMNLLHILAKYVEVTEDQIKALLGIIPEEKKSLIEEEDSKGSRPIHIAAQEGHLEIVRALIDAKADINKVTRYGDTALHIAAEKGHLGIVKALINKGADIDIVAEGEATALHIAAHEGHLEIVRALIDAKADIDIVAEGEATPLHIAAHEGHLEIVKLLIANIPTDDDKKDYVNQATEGGATALYIAAEKGHLGIVQALIEAGANVDQATVDVAAQNNHLEIVEALNNKKQPNHICQTSGSSDVDSPVSIQM